MTCTPPQFIATSGYKIAASVAAPAGDGTETKCQNLCLEYLNCTGVDYTTDNKCFLTYNAIGPLVEESGTTHFQAQRTCTEGKISK